MHAADRGPAGEHAAVDRECRGELAGCHGDLSDNQLEHGRFGRLLLQPRECLFRDALVTARQPEPRLGALSVERRERAVMRGGGRIICQRQFYPREHLARLRVLRHCSDRFSQGHDRLLDSSHVQQRGAEEQHRRSERRLQLDGLLQRRDRVLGVARHVARHSEVQQEAGVRGPLGHQTFINRGSFVEALGLHRRRALG